MRFGEVFTGLNVAAKNMLQKFQVFTKRVHSNLSNYVQILNENGNENSNENLEKTYANYSKTPLPLIMVLSKTHWKKFVSNRHQVDF